MRIQSLLVIGLLGAACALAQDDADIASVQPQSQSFGSLYGGPQTKMAMYIWTDKYTYQAGQTATVKWTVKTNADLYPYTMLVYRQNNQTGVKTYLPANTTAVTDFKGNTLAAGFAPAALTDATKATLATVTIPNELGMHTFVVELRDYLGTRVIKSAYMKIGVVGSVKTLTGTITTDTTLTNDTQWNLSGIVTVKNNATLTVEPGTIVLGQPGTTPPSVLLITTSGKIVANGTKSRPIIMTSSQPFGQRKRGDWGGVLMLGKARVNVPANTSGGATCGTTGCSNAAGTFYIEGLVANNDGLYGGTDDNHSCGSLKYVRLEYAGSILSPNNETNSFTWAGCGKGTVSEHLQAIYGMDDSFEWFGGTADAKWLVGGLGADDYVDFQLGYTGRIQFGLFYQSPDSKGNRGIEGDNSEYDAASLPFSNPTMYNLTFMGSGQPGFDEIGTSDGIFLRRGSRGSFNNIVVTNFSDPAVNISDASTQAQADLGNVIMNGILAYNNNLISKGANTDAGQVRPNYTLLYAQGQKGNVAGKNFAYNDALLNRPFEYSDPDFSTRFGSPIFRSGWVAPPDDGFFDQSAKFLGGIGDEDWTQEWTSFLVDSDLI